MKNKPILLILKMTKYTLYGFLFQMLILNVVLAHKIEAQKINEVYVSISFDEEKLIKVLKEIEVQSEFHFTVHEGEQYLDQRVSVHRLNETVEGVLKDIGRQTGLSFQQVNNNIAIRPPDLSSYRELDIQNEVKVSGTVTDETGSPIPGVTIRIEGTSAGTVTDVDGKFSINVEQGQTLQVSFIGYVTKEVVVESDIALSIQLEPDVANLEEVVVVGYGTLDKRDITGSVGSIKFDDELNSLPAVDFGQAMYGKIPGVQVLNASGRPGMSSTIQVRGINSISAGNSPLIVVDGVQLPGYDLNVINTSDIESIEVLKDAASASIYGSRGANGVILVTTKSGKQGKSVLKVDYSTSVQQVIRKLDVMNTAEYAQAAIDAAQNGWIDSGGDPLAPNTIEARGNYKYTWPEELENPGTLPNTNWQDEVFRMAPMHKVNVSLSGGDKKTNYSFSGGYVNQKGIVLASEYQKYTLNIKVSSKIKEWLSVGGMINTLYDNEDEPYSRIVEWAAEYPSLYPVYDEDGHLGGPASLEGFENYYAILFRPVNGHPLYRIDDDINHKRFTAIGNVFSEVSILPGLKFKTMLNVFTKRADNTNYMVGDNNLGEENIKPASFSSNMSRTINYNWQNLLSYEGDFGDHSVNFLLGYEDNNRDHYFLVGQRKDFANDNIPYLSGGATVFEANDVAYQTKLISYFSRANYSFKNRYILSASFRRDGSSRFGPDNKWGNFPSISAAWRVHEESFMPKNNVLDNLKLRVSYGFTGNDNFADYRWVSKLEQAYVALGNNNLTSYYPSSVENPSLEWERTKQLNFGMDVGLFQNRINLEGNFYISTSDGLLLDVPIPSTSGFSRVFSNNGEVVNRGVELNLITNNIDRALKWTSTFNIAMNRSEVTKLGRDDAPLNFGMGIFGAMKKRIEVGQPIFSYYGYKYDGVYMSQEEIDADPTHYPSATPGDGKYVDVNGDGVLDPDDRTILGSYEPDFTWGFTNNFSFKNFNFSFLLQGVVGGKIYDESSPRSLLYHEGRNYKKELVNRWRSEEEPGDGYHYKLTTVLNGYEKTVSDYWLSDASFMRLKSLTVGYNLPKSTASKMGLTNLRIFINGTNLFTTSKANVFDPENFLNQNANITNPLYRGATGYAYPTAKTYSIGINIDL